MILADVNIPAALPQWMKDHVDRYLRSDGRDGHMYTTNFPNQPQRTVPSLLLVTKGRKSGDKHLFPLFYGRAGKSYYVIASKGGAPDHPGWYKNLLADPEVEKDAQKRFNVQSSRSAPSISRPRRARRAAPSDRNSGTMP